MTAVLVLSLALLAAFALVAVLIAAVESAESRELGAGDDGEG